MVKGSTVNKFYFLSHLLYIINVYLGMWQILIFYKPFVWWNIAVTMVIVNQLDLEFKQITIVFINITKS